MTQIKIFIMDTLFIQLLYYIYISINILYIVGALYNGRVISVGGKTI